MNLYFALPLALAAVCLLGRVASEGLAFLYRRHYGELSYPHRLREREIARAAALACLGALSGAALPLQFPEPLAFAAQFLLSQCAFAALVSDYEQEVIFDRVLLLMIALALVASPVLAAPLWDRALALAAGGGAMLMLALLLPSGALGGGDVKLLGALGFWLGLDALPTVFAAGFLGGGLAALALLLRGRGRRAHFAYGPYFIYGAFLYLFTSR